MHATEKAQQLADLHVKGNPLILYNAWDAGSAKAIANAGASAIATSSWAVAAAHGHADGEYIPYWFVEKVIARIVDAVAAPVTVDVEGGYSDDPQDCADNIAQLVDHGVAGINFEDRVVAGSGLHSIELQCRRIAAIRMMAQARGVPLFINARTDVFFGTGAAIADGLVETLERANAYAAAGASGLFVPGLTNLATIAALCERSPLPVNVMTLPGLPTLHALADVGVARISHGPSPFLKAMEAVEQAARLVLASAA